MRINDRYEIIGKLGSGGTGTVFKVRDGKIGKIWAAKLITSISDQEIRALKEINCPTFPRIVDSVSGEQGTFIIMDYIEGRSLRAYTGGRNCNEKDRLRWAMELAAALKTLHDATPSMLYLDCKPDNIIIDASGHLHLVDMGSIYMKDMSDPGRISGTEAFASPEQKRGERPDKYSDVYSYGRTLERIVIPDKGDRLLKSIIGRCTRENPEARFQSMNEILHTLDKGRGHVNSQAIICRTVDIMVKLMIGLFTVLSFKYYSDYLDLLYLILGNMLLLLLWNICKDRVAMFRMEDYICYEDIHMGRGAKVLGILIASVSLAITMGSVKAYAETDKSVTLYDSEGYKVLYKGQRISVLEDNNIKVFIPSTSIVEGSGPVRAERSKISKK